MSVYVMRKVCFLIVLFLAVINSQRIEDSIGLELEQDEIIDEEFERALLDEDILLDENVLDDSFLLEEDTLEENLKDAPHDESENIPSGSSLSSSSPLNLRIVETLSGSLENLVASFNSSYNVAYEEKNEDDTDQHALVTAFFVTMMSELGDKTFFMSAILAMHHSRTLTFIGTTIGQTIMTLVAVFFGMVASLIPSVYTQWASAIIMTFFGIKMLRDGAQMDDSPDGRSKAMQEKTKTIEKKEETSEEQKKQDENVENKTEENENNDLVKANNQSNGDINLDSKKNGLIKNKPEVSKKPPEYTKGVLLQAMTLCLMGEWGDKSQIATILLASHEDPYLVAAGGILAHILCNVIAVFGGRMLASKFPAKIVTQLGGVFFLLAAASSFVFS